MNKTEKLICIVLGLALVAFFWNEKSKASKIALAAQTESAASVASAGTSEAKATAVDSVAAQSKTENVASAPKRVLPPERVVTLENDDVKLFLTTHGAAVKKVTLKRYAQKCGELSAENPAVELDFASAPMGAADQVEAFEIVEQNSDSVVFAAGEKRRRITLKADYQIEFDDHGIVGEMSLGAMAMGSSKNDLLSVDSWARDAGKGKAGVVHHGDDDSPLKPYLVGGLTGGCSGSKSAAGMPAETKVEYPGEQSWVALKNRFFVSAFVSSSEANRGFSAKVARDMTAANYKPERISAAVAFVGDDDRKTLFYVGPKQQSLLWKLGMKDVMEFGMWRWLCYPLVWILNLFHGWMPSFGIAIILLTILVRVVFWPLTHKSTVGMKKMQELQPKMKEIQTKFKDNPQRMQQETWALYREAKVNPMSSCLPMLIQIPVFIALFNVLRSAVELRYAPFLWIADLSEPEALFASWFPFGGLNLLPILMAVTTGLQSAFTPSTGDKSQQKMMMVFMPLMMLVMFYSFPSALSLYWFLSNLFSIGQMWIIRRQAAAKQASAVLVPDEVIDPPQTRQMRRHG